jgi:hypothetical protein
VRRSREGSEAPLVRGRADEQRPRSRIERWKELEEE